MGRRRVTLLWSEDCRTQLRCYELGQSKGDPHIDREKLVMFNNQMQLEHILQCLPPVTEWNSSSTDVNSKPPIDFRHLEVHLPNIQFAVVCTQVGWCPSGTTHSCKDISTMLHFATVTLSFLMCFITVGDSQNILINVSLVKIKKKYWLLCFYTEDCTYFYKYSENSEHLEHDFLLCSQGFDTSSVPSLAEVKLNRAQMLPLPGDSCISSAICREIPCDKPAGGGGCQPWRGLAAAARAWRSLLLGLGSPRPARQAWVCERFYCL